jgi:hypothetical protein
MENDEVKAASVKDSHIKVTVKKENSGHVPESGGRHSICSGDYGGKNKPFEVASLSDRRIRVNDELDFTGHVPQSDTVHSNMGDDVRQSETRIHHYGGFMEMVNTTVHKSGPSQDMDHSSSLVEDSWNWSTLLLTSLGPFRKWSSEMFASLGQGFTTMENSWRWSTVKFTGLDPVRRETTHRSTTMEES